MLECQRDTCKIELSRVLDQEDMAECNKCIHKIKEETHFKTLECQRAKFGRLHMKDELKNKGGHSKDENMHRYMYQSGTDNSSQTTTTSTARPGIDFSRSTTTTSTAPKCKWVITMSKKPLTKAQEKLLAHGPSFAITPRSPPIGEYITSVKQTCQGLAQGKVDEMRAEIKAVLKKIQSPRPNITREEQKALKELRKDNTRVVLTADKGMCLVVMDKEEYIKKAEELLNQETYKIIPSDPTNRQRSRLIQILKKIKEEGGMNEETYKKMYPTCAGIPKFYGLPKIFKTGVPLRPIVSSIGSVAYGTANELAWILKPLAGRSPYSVQNTKNFVEQLKNIHLQPEECIISYDVKALFTLVPIEPAIKIIQHLVDDQELQQRTSMTVKQTHHLYVGVLLEECLLHFSRQVL